MDDELRATDSAAVRVLEDVRIPRPFGSLSADVYLPGREGKWPALITVLPYRKDLTGSGWASHLTWFAERGFAGVLVDLGGYGMSDGAPVAKMDPREGEDAVAVINWAASQE